MTVDVIRLVRLDDRPFIILTLTDDISGQPYDLTPVDTEVTVRFRAAGTETTLSEIPCTLLTDGTDGKVRFDFSGGILDVPPGAYEGQISIFSAGARQTVYELLRFRIRENFQDP